MGRHWLVTEQTTPLYNIVLKMTLSEIIASEAETDLEIPSEVEAPLPSAAKKKKKAKKSAKKSKKAKKYKKAKKAKKSKKPKKIQEISQIQKAGQEIQGRYQSHPTSSTCQSKKSSWWSHTFSIRRQKYEKRQKAGHRGTAPEAHEIY